MIRRLLVSFFICASVLHTTAQDGDYVDTVYTSVDSVEFEADTVYIEDSRMIILNAGFMNQKSRFVTDTLSTNPALFFNFFYNGKSGFAAQLSVSRIFRGSEPTYDTQLKIGYEKSFGRFDVSLLGGLHRFRGDELLEGINYKYSADAGLAFNPGTFSLYADYTFMSGKSNNSFLNIGVSKYFDIEGIFKDDDVITIEPNIYMVFASDYWIFDDVNNQIEHRVRRSISRKGYTENVFSLFSTDMGVSVSYTNNNFMATASVLSSFTSNKYKHLRIENQTSYMLSFIYMIEL